MKEGERNAKRRKTELDSNNSTVMAASDSDPCDTSYEEVPCPSSNTSVDNTDEEYIPAGTSSIITHHYSPARSRTSTSASGSSIKSSREDFSGDNSNSSDDSPASSRSRDQYSDQDDVATEIVGRLSPDEYRDRLVDQGICKEYSSSDIDKVIKKINELKRSLPSSGSGSPKSAAAYVTQTFELRGTITTVAEQLSNSRQMEKSLKSRLKQAVSEIEDLRDDKHSLRKDLHETNDALKKAEELLAAKDDIINRKEMELFIVRNDLELTKRAQLKAETEKKHLELVLNAKTQYFENMQFHFQQAFSKPKISTPKPAPAQVVFPTDPQRYKYYAPNYNFNKKATATVSKESPMEPIQHSHIPNATQNFRIEGEHVGLAGRVGETFKDLKESDKMNAESESRDTQMESESSDFLKTEDEDSSTCRSESPVELIISAEDDDFDEDLSQKERFRFR